MTHPTQDVANLSITALHRAMAAEFEGLVSDCRGLEIIVGEIFASVPQGHLLRDLQAFDLIIQRIEGCAKVLEAVADHAPAAWIPAQDIIGGVSLAALASRLSGQGQGQDQALAHEMEIW